MQKRFDDALNLREQIRKSVATMLATENVAIRYGKYSTSFVDMDARVIYMPELKEVYQSTSIQEYMVCHEVGHLLETPREGWHNATEIEGLDRGVLNVLEDIRMERMVQDRYPGFRKYFYEGRLEMVRLGQFCDLESLERRTKLTPENKGNAFNLIDRINIFASANIGVLQEEERIAVDFDATEHDFVRRSFATETWEDVVELAREIQDKIESDGQQPVAVTKGSGEPNSADEGTDESGACIQPAQDGESGSSTEGDIEAKSNDSVDGGNKSLSETDDHFRQNESSLYKEPEKIKDENNNMREVVDLHLPTRKEFLKRIVALDEWLPIAKGEFNTAMNGENSIIDCNYKRAYTEYRQGKYYNCMIRANEAYKKILSKYRNQIENAVRVFEMKKQSWNTRNTSYHRTGRIDGTRLAYYRTHDDIFSKLELMPDCQNHGVVMLIDFSNSMWRSIEHVIEQVVMLCAFCRRLKVKFRVYSFTSDRNSFQEFDDCSFVQLNISELHMVELANDRMTNQEHEIAMTLLVQKLAFLDKKYGMYNNGRDTWTEEGRKLRHIFDMSATPLIEALLCMQHVIDDFLAESNVDNASFICLTDGDNQQIRTTGFFSGFVRLNIGSMEICFNSSGDSRQVPGFLVKSLRKHLRMSAVSIDIVNCVSMAELYRSLKEHGHIGWNHQFDKSFGDDEVKSRNEAMNQEFIEAMGIMTGTGLNGYDLNVYIANETMNGETAGKTFEDVSGFSNYLQRKKDHNAIFKRVAETVSQQVRL